MEKSKNPIPEMKDFLNQDKLLSEIENACRINNQEALYNYITKSVKSFEERLKVYYMKKNVHENDKYTKEDEEFLDDWDELYLL